MDLAYEHDAEEHLESKKHFILNPYKEGTLLCSLRSVQSSVAADGSGNTRGRSGNRLGQAELSRCNNLAMGQDRWQMSIFLGENTRLRNLEF